MKFIVAGLGFGEQHLSWLSQCRDAEIVGILARAKSARAEELGSRFNNARISSDLDELIRATRADAFVAVTPPRSHAPMLRLALDAGLLAISDKPLTADVASARGLVERVSADPSRGAVTFQWRQHPGVAYLRECLAANDIGRLSHLELRHHHEFLSGQETGCPWRHQRDQAGAGTLGDQGVHLFDLLRFVSGQEWVVEAAAGHVMWPTRTYRGERVVCETEDVADVALRTSDGACRAFVHTTRVASGTRALQLRAYGTAGALELDVHADTGSGALRHLKSSGESSRVAYDSPSMNPYAPLFAPEPSSVHRLIPRFSDGLAAQSLLDAAVSLMHHRAKDLHK